MDMDQAAVFLAGSILTMLGFVVIIVGLVVINNVIHKYWKPLGWFKNWGLFPEHSPVRFAELHELDKSKEPKVK
jgi:hypothetical protein